MEWHYYLVYRNKKEHLWITLFQQIRQFRWNGQIPRKAKVTKMTLGKTGNVDRPIISKEIKLVIIKLLIRKSPDPCGFTGKFCKIFKG